MASVSPMLTGTLNTSYLLWADGQLLAFAVNVEIPRLESARSWRPMCCGRKDLVGSPVHYVASNRSNTEWVLVTSIAKSPAIFR